MAEWSIAAVLKTVEPRGSGGSNPSPSAISLPDHTVLQEHTGVRALDSPGPPGWLAPPVRTSLADLDRISRNLRDPAQARVTSSRYFITKAWKGQTSGKIALGSVQSRHGYRHMFIPKQRPWQSPEADVTPKGLYLNRRKIIASGGALALTRLECLRGAIGSGQRRVDANGIEASEWRTRASHDRLSGRRPSDALSPPVTGYNNFYEFGIGKDDPARYASALTTDPLVRSKSKGMRPEQAGLRWKMWSISPTWKSASTVCGVSRPGRWSSRGSASRSHPC